MPAPCCMSVLWYQINQDALIVYSLWVLVFIVCMLKSWVSYLSLCNMATGPVCALDRSVQKHIKPRELEWFMQLLSGAQKLKDTSLDHCSVLHSFLLHSFFFLWNVFLPCLAQVVGLHFHSSVQNQTQKPDQTQTRPKSHGKHLPPPGPEHHLSLFKPMGAVSAPHLVLSKSLSSPVDSTVPNTAHLILARHCKGTHLRTNLGPSSQNGGAQGCKPKNEVCSQVPSELHAVLVQRVFAMPLLSCRYIV